MPIPNNTLTVSADDAIRADVAVIGAGVVGHGIAWEIQRSGRSVALIDDAPGAGASWAAAGMLAPVSELHYQEEDLLDLMLEASSRWPGFAAGVAAAAAAGDRIPDDADPRRGCRRRRPEGADGPARRATGQRAGG